MTCHCSLGNASGHSHDLPPDRCYCCDGVVKEPSDHWPSCPKYRIPRHLHRLDDERWIETPTGLAKCPRCYPKESVA